MHKKYVHYHILSICQSGSMTLDKVKKAHDSNIDSESTSFWNENVLKFNEKKAIPVPRSQRHQMIRDLTSLDQCSDPGAEDEVRIKYHSWSHLMATLFRTRCTGRAAWWGCPVSTASRTRSRGRSGMHNKYVHFYILSICQCGSLKWLLTK